MRSPGRNFKCLRAHKATVRFIILLIVVFFLGLVVVIEHGNVDVCRCWRVLLGRSRGGIASEKVVLDVGVRFGAGLGC